MTFARGAKSRGRASIVRFFVDHCECVVCSESFVSTRAFDKHLTGDWPQRRCMSPPEMLAGGLEVSDRGWRLPHAPRAQVSA